MATSTEKVLGFIAELNDQPDDELAKIMPMLPSFVVRPALAAAAGQVPDDPEQLDQWMLRAAAFLLGLRSDDAEPVELMAAGELAQIGPAPTDDDDAAA